MLKGIKKHNFDGKTLFNYDQLLNLGRNSNTVVKTAKFVPNKLVTTAYTSESTGQSKGCDAS